MQRLDREPIFQSGGLKRLGLWMLGLAFTLAISIPLYLVLSPVTDFLVDWVRGVN